MSNQVNREAVRAAGGIPALVTLLRQGANGPVPSAAWALAQLTQGSNEAAEVRIPHCLQVMSYGNDDGSADHTKRLQGDAVTQASGPIFQTIASFFIDLGVTADSAN